MTQRRDTDFVMQVPNYIRILALLYNCPSIGTRVYNIGRRLDITNARVCHIKITLEQLGYIESTANGREVLVELTESGKQIGLHCSKLVKLLMIKR